MRDGKCPKCGSNNVFTRKDGINYGSFEISIAFLVTHSPANDYICTDCGYFDVVISFALLGVFVCGSRVIGEDSFIDDVFF